MKKPVITAWMLCAIALLLPFRLYGMVPSLSVEGYARETPPGASMSAAYLSLLNTGQSELLLTAVELPKAKDADADLHTTERVEGVSRMRPLQQLAIAAGEQLQMAPGGIHLMIRGLRLRAGESLALRLVFADGSSLEVQVPIVPLGAAEKDHHHHHG